MSSNDDAAAARQLLDLINASWIAQACYVAARLGIAELLAAGPRTADDLATATATHAPALLQRPFVIECPAELSDRLEWII